MILSVSWKKPIPDIEQNITVKLLMGQKILLTGATGFLGSHLLKNLLRDNCEVILLKRSFSNVNRIKEIKSSTRGVLSFDIDCTDIEEVFATNEIDIIIHTATEYGRGDMSIRSILEANLIFPIRLVELGIKYNVKSFINTDSYFNKETFTYSHLLNYSLSKKSFLSWLKQLSTSIQIVNVGLEHVYGPFDGQLKFVEMSVRNIAERNVVRMAMTHGHQKRDFIYIDDVVNAYLLLMRYALEHKFTFKHFEVGTGQCREIKDVPNIIKKLSKSSTDLGFGDIPYRLDEIMGSYADTTMISELGWKAKITLEEGLTNILDQYALLPHGDK